MLFLYYFYFVSFFFQTRRTRIFEEIEKKTHKIKQITKEEEEEA